MSLTHWDTEPTPPEMPQSFDCERFLSDYWDRRAKAEADEQDELQAWVSELTYNSHREDSDPGPEDEEPMECRCGNCDDVLNDEGRCSLCAHHAAMED